VQLKQLDSIGDDTMTRTSRSRCLLTSLGTLARASVLSATLAGPPRGGHGPGHPRPGGPDRKERLFDKLDLSQKQREQAEAVFAEQKEAVREIHERLGAARGEMFEKVHADTLDERAVREVAARIAADEAELALSRARGWQKLRGILTPDQQAMARELFEKRREHAQERFDHLRMGAPAGPHAEGEDPEGL
jgi:protein CpxP